MRTENKKSIEYWQDLVRRGAEDPVGIRSFCEVEGIRRSAFYYWRRRLGRKKQPERKHSAFAKVEIMPAARPALAPRLPNPKWLAEFLLALGTGGAQ